MYGDQKMDKLKGMEPIQLNTDAINSFKETSKSIANMLSAFADISRKLEEMMKPVFESLANFSKMVSEIIPTNFMKSFSDMLQEINENPDSVFNYYKYENHLDNFHWAWPYEITTSEIKNLIESVSDEKKFDDYMLKFFSEKKVNDMMDKIEKNIPAHHRILFRQIENAYRNKNYAIANNALMTILDNLLSDYLLYKGQTKRKGILKPIADFWMMFFPDDLLVVFRLMMIANNIDFIFQDYHFNEKIVFETNKQARRHTALHGFKYSNKKVDALMLMNTLLELLNYRTNLHIFCNSLVVDKKTKDFIIQESSMKKILRPIVKMLIVECLEIDKEFEGEGVSHRQIMEYVNMKLSLETSFITSKFISSILQSMKKAKSPIISVKKNGTILWRIVENNDSIDNYGKAIT